MKQPGPYGESPDLETPVPSPLCADPHGFPHMLVQVGEVELFRGGDEGFAQRADQAGVRAKSHVWTGM